MALLYCQKGPDSESEPLSVSGAPESIWHPLGMIDIFYQRLQTKVKCMIHALMVCLTKNHPKTQNILIH